MVQVQSSWFPLYDRNPQTFVPNIFFAKPADYVKATQRVFHKPDAASYIDLPVAQDEARLAKSRHDDCRKFAGVRAWR